MEIRRKRRSVVFLWGGGGRGKMVNNSDAHSSRVILERFKLVIGRKIR